MPRPSQNVDQLLLDAGLELLPQTGCAGLSVRKLADHAGVNLGMFHYHFKNKDTFIRAVLQRVYEEMFSALTLKVDQKRPVLDNLRAVLAVLARFGREQHPLLLRMAADAMAGEAAVIEFFSANLPRHVAVVLSLVMQAQREGLIVDAPPQEAIAFLAGAVGAPVLIGGALGSRAPAPVVAAIEHHVLSDAAVARRIDYALRGLAA
ncbi:TetR/AcrR family transcriptional regulator [Piscinibacter sp. HJYY11]|uniref:TetR/AcrR family transcriptional regulator n=1 Tax=Piscinibacter sp. HJYY11 TaxID=2801333 RepID=UPI00191FA029|nr:TetR/AcrR family transcriptional regulator [Piscinibacter sp. HJYY11]MBL0728286.1 TetR/AcrR family transcriptional regulator [Piscinibacter sp. HJYY11]